MITDRPDGESLPASHAEMVVAANSDDVVKLRTGRSEVPDPGRHGSSPSPDVTRCPRHPSGNPSSLAPWDCGPASTTGPGANGPGRHPVRRRVGTLAATDRPPRSTPMRARGAPLFRCPHADCVVGLMRQRYAYIYFRWLVVALSAGRGLLEVPGETIEKEVCEVEVPGETVEPSERGTGARRAPSWWRKRSWRYRLVEKDKTVGKRWWRRSTAGSPCGF